jgi:hypothetical protein
MVMDEDTYRRARERAESARRLLLDRAQARRLFTVLHNVAEWCYDTAYERCGQHNGEERLVSDAKAAFESTVAKEGNPPVDARALRKVVARVHLNNLADQLRESHSRLRAVWPGVLHNGKSEELDAAAVAVVDQVITLLTAAVTVAGYAALCTYDGPDVDGAVDAGQRGELVELERQVSRLAFSAYGANR